ncbi:MAG: NTP transferase domain-containing protein [Candidatus Wildermuthbacteria bacterium]|nr:NTP transferase domain-containing protein [Candidatus Wildermuthbacteria bacterium]
MGPDIVVMAGGYGTRMGPLAQKYGCKSLIPLNGIPALEYVIRALAFATVGQGRIILCIERPELYPSIYSLVGRIEVARHVEIYCDSHLKGTIHALYRLRSDLQGESIFVLYGHQPIDPGYFVRMQMHGKESETLITLYPTSSNVSRKISVVRNGRISDLLQGGKEAGLEKSQYYIDVPYRFPMKFVQEQKDEYVRSHEAVQRWLEAKHKVKGRVARFPHEFHYPGELVELAEFTRKLQEKLPGMEKSAA